MGDLNVLILDDDEMWLARHERRLRQAGFKCHTTQLAKEAIEIANTNAAIKFALIDEILFVPPVPLDETQAELQRWQGSGVVREIAAHRFDIQIIMVTSAPQLRSHGDNLLFSRETAKLRRQRGVIDIVHKQDIEADPDGEYHWLINFLKTFQPATKVEVLKPRILIGLGVREEVLAGAKYKRLRQCLKDTGASEYELNAVARRFIAKLQPLEKTVFIETPGSKKLDRCTNIKPNSQSFQILEILAQRAEQQAEVVIGEADYQYASRKSLKEGAIDPDLDRRAVEDFAFGYNADGRKGLRQGVQIEGRNERSSRLKVAIHRLNQQLVKLNVDRTDQLFKAESGGYRAMFEIGIVLYGIDAKKSHRSEKMT